MTAPDNRSTTEHLPEHQTDKHSLSSVVIPLMKGVLYRDNDPDLWETLLNLQARVRDYVAVLGLDLLLDESEGYAFLRSQDESGGEPLLKRPRLIARRALSFPLSLLLALLRKKLAEFDAGGGETRLILSRDDIVELMRVFLPDGSNEARLVDQVDGHLNKIAEMGFIRPLRDQKKVFEIMRILKSFVDAQWLAEFDEKLKAYRTRCTARKGAAADD